MGRTTRLVLQHALDCVVVYGIEGDIASCLIHISYRYTLGSSISLCRELASNRCYFILYGDIDLVLVKSGYVLRDFTPSLDDHVKERNFRSEMKKYYEHMHRTNGIVKYGSDSSIRNSFVVDSGEQEGTKVVWIARAH